MKKYALLIVIINLIISCKTQEAKSLKSYKQVIAVAKTTVPMVIDGNPAETIWQDVKWYPIDQKWLGDDYDSNDFKGQYKLTWDKNALYVLVEIQDDILFDQHKDPLKLWWDDDCVEVFIDENNSGGNHQYNHNAFAYHVALDGNVVDIAPSKTPTLYNNHIKSKHKTNGNTTLWELKINIYDDSYADGKENTPITLKANKNIGFAIAYCDNDNSKTRENFIGSQFVAGEDKNLGWKDASIFGTIQLKK